MLSISAAGKFSFGFVRSRFTYQVLRMDLSVSLCEKRSLTVVIRKNGCVEICAAGNRRSECTDSWTGSRYMAEK